MKTTPSIQALQSVGLLLLTAALFSCSTAPKQEVREHVTGPLNLVMEEPYGPVGDLSLEEYQRGVALVSRSGEALARPESDETIQHLGGLGVNSMALVVSWYQDTAQSELIFAKPSQSVKDEALVHAINQAHRSGIRVMLKPHVDVLDGTFRGEIAPSEAWFKSYREFILHYARIAEKYHVSLFCVGTELENASYAQWQKEWEGLIAEVRTIYRGKLTYAANWTEYETVSFWNRVDLIGIDAYFPVTKKTDPTQEELDRGWEEIAGKISAWRSAKQIDKPLIFTEIGYQSADGANVTPWQTTSRTEDQEEQAMVLEGMFRAMESKVWFKGMYWWNYFPRESWRPLDFTIKGKKAEQVLKKWYEKEENS